jgi:hypothetical protein
MPSQQLHEGNVVDVGSGQSRKSRTWDDGARPQSSEVMAMNYLDLECKILTTATELFGFAMKETSTEAEQSDAVEGIIRDVLERYPDITAEKLAFAMGRAFGRFEGQRKAKQR